MVANRVLAVRIPKDQYDELKDIAKRKGYLQLAPYIRYLLLREKQNEEPYWRGFTWMAKDSFTTKKEYK